MGARHRADLRRGPFAATTPMRRSSGIAERPAGERAGCSGRRARARATPCAWVRAGDGRHPDDPRRRPHRAARGSAALLRGAPHGQGRVRQRRAARLPDGRAGDAVLPTWSATSSSAWRSPGCSASRSRTRSAAPRCSGERDYERIAANRAYFGDFDPFGDFDLLFGAAKLNLKIVELPIRYRERTYGTTNIQRWRHGWLLLKMVVFAAGRIKFI